jgi:hypothetical protein
VAFYVPLLEYLHRCVAGYAPDIAKPMSRMDLHAHQRAERLSDPEGRAADAVAEARRPSAEIWRLAKEGNNRCQRTICYLGALVRCYIDL